MTFFEIRLSKGMYIVVMLWEFEREVRRSNNLPLDNIKKVKSPRARSEILDVAGD